MSQSEPAPREVQHRVTCGLLMGAQIALPTPSFDDKAEFFDILESRRSLQPQREIDNNALGRLLWYGARCKERAIDPRGITRQRRPFPSAGGLHEQEIIVVRHEYRDVSRYDGVTHALSSAQPEPERFLRFVEHVRCILENDATLICLMAHKCVLEGAYLCNDSLLWRDAGCALAMMQLTASALGFCSTLIGITGEDLAKAVPSSCSGFVATGVMAVGL